MQKSWIFLFTCLVAGWLASGNAAVVVIGGPGVVLTNRQPIQAVIVDSNGNTFQQNVFYDSAIGGVDLDTSWAGPNASVYFPTIGTGYVWYNGYWVDQTGYYWNGKNRVYIGHPNWNNYWSGYWHGRNHWNGGWHEGSHGGWHGDWHGHENFHGNEGHHHRH